MKAIHKISMAVSVLSLFACETKTVEINYLGQKPPGMKAELFAPGILSTNANEHSAVVFSPDGGVVLWAVMDSQYRGRLFEMKYQNGSWSKPASPAFADTTSDDYSPSFSPDGNTLFFSSRRKAPVGYPEGRGNRIWSVAKTPDGWGIPEPLDTTVSKSQEFGHSVSKNGTLYFASTPGGPSLNIQKAEATKARFAKPVLLPYNINSIGYEDGPYIAPNEDFLVFESARPEGIDGSIDLYITFKNKDGNWGMPVNMGPAINSGSSERFARISPDGKYLFFGSNKDNSAGKIGFDFYWIDAKIIDELRNTEVARTIIDQPLGNEILDALNKNDVAVSAGLLKKWLGLYSYSLDATVLYSSILRKQKRYSEAEQLFTTSAIQWNENTDAILELALVKFGAEKDDEAARLVAPIFTKGNELHRRYLYLSNALLDMELFNPSDEYFEKAMAINPTGVAWYNRACGCALAGQPARAFKALHKAAELGYTTKANYENDPDLESLKTDAQWKVLMENLP